MKRMVMLTCLALLAGQQAFAEDVSVGQKVGNGIKKGGEAAGRGIGKGIDATGKGLRKGAEATGRGLEKAGQWIQKKTHKSDEK